MEYDRKLHEHLARIGAGLMGLMALQAKTGAPLADVISYPDRVEFNFERVAYQITRVPAICTETADDQL